MTPSLKLLTLKKFAMLQKRMINLYLSILKEFWLKIKYNLVDLIQVEAKALKLM